MGAHRATGRIAGILEDKICLVQGRTYVFNSSISQYAEIRIHPSVLGDRCVAVADLYALWRPKTIKFKAITLGSAANVCVGHMYPEGNSGSITTMEEFVDLPACAYGNGLIGAPLPVLTLEREYWEKSQMTQWLATTLNIDNQLENAGFLIYGNENATMTSQNFRGVIEWEFEFKSMIDPQVSLARMLEERKYPEQFPALPSATIPVKEEGREPVPPPTAGVSQRSPWNVLPRLRPS